MSQRIGCIDDKKNELLKDRNENISNSFEEKQICKRIHSRSSVWTSEMFFFVIILLLLLNVIVMPLVILLIKNIMFSFFSRFF
jgi:type IV secretory pathway component VirB8